MVALEDVELSLKLRGSEGLKALQNAQRRLLALRLQAGGLVGDGRLGRPVCVVFEGWDASGKGGAIRRLTSALNPRHVRVAQFAAPSETERRRYFLWRFWPARPGWGGMAVFDRSWYGRVLVERVEGLATEPEWRRAYDEIVAFERSVCSEGMVLVKLWLHVSDAEQLRRFKARERDPLKRWKLTDEDWRNVAQRPAYEQAVAEMLRHTDHEHAAWTLIPAENKPFAHVAVVDAVIDAIERGLRDAGQEPLDAEAAL